MKNSFNFFSSTTGIVVTGLILGLIAVFLQFSGNPGNMGICVVCFNRDIAGAVGLHRAPIVQYLRPEIMGMVLGSLAAALCFGEYRARGGSAPAVRFLLGVIAAIGALVFLGCPWRVIMRLAGGDANALFGLAGLVVGIGLGTVFFWASPNPETGTVSPSANMAVPSSVSGSSSCLSSFLRKMPRHPGLTTRELFERKSMLSRRHSIRISSFSQQGENASSIRPAISV